MIRFTVKNAYGLLTGSKIGKLSGDVLFENNESGK